ncbi:MAG: hypothetical protein HY092_03785 [Candidatus Kerfeldbacteria bacterium]|nr:hypothetical protein [Candidatus Kerfeldbacteria bacterium]
MPNGSGQSDQTLVETVVGMMCNSISTRHQAADLLHQVAEVGSAGCFPSGVTCEQLGRALHRIAMNSPEGDPLLGIITGWRAAEQDFRRRCGDPTA